VNLALDAVGISAGHALRYGTSSVRGITGPLLLTVTHGEDQAVMELVALIAPGVVSFPGAQRTRDRRI
jgi:hypothetical protein